MLGDGADGGAVTTGRALSGGGGREEREEERGEERGEE